LIFFISDILLQWVDGFLSLNIREVVNRSLYSRWGGLIKMRSFGISNASNFAHLWKKVAFSLKTLNKMENIIHLTKDVLEIIVALATLIYFKKGK